MTAADQLIALLRSMRENARQARHPNSGENFRDINAALKLADQVRDELVEVKSKGTALTHLVTVEELQDAVVGARAVDATGDRWHKVAPDMWEFLDQTQSSSYALDHVWGPIRIEEAE